MQPDKKLKKDALETYGMYDVERIKYQAAGPGSPAGLTKVTSRWSTGAYRENTHDIQVLHGCTSCTTLKDDLL